MIIRTYAPQDEPAVIRLWQECGLTRPWNDPRRAIARKLIEQPELFLVGTIDDQVVATVMAGFDGHRGHINYLAVSPEHRHKSLGKLIMAEAERLLLELGCPKINLQVRTSNVDVIAFYMKVGYTVDEVVSLGKRLIED